MSEYTIELFWRCGSDKTLNRGLAAFCEGCGKPKQPTDEEVWPDDISESNAIRDPEQLRLAKAGPDWQCKFCDTLQNSTGQFCVHCGADRQTGARPWKALETTVTQDTQTGRKAVSTRETTVVLGIYPAERRSLGPWTPAPLGRDSEEIRQTDGGATVCRIWKDHPGCWAYDVDGGRTPRSARSAKDAKDLADAEARAMGWALRNPIEIEIPPEVKSAYDVEPPSPSEGYRSAPKHTRPRMKTALEMAAEEIETEKMQRQIRTARVPELRTLFLIAIAAVVIIGILYLLFRERIVDTQVSALEWKRLTMIERKSAYPFEGWSPPSDAFDIRDLGKQLHHYEKVLVGSHQEPYTDRYSCGQNCTTTPRVCTSIPRTCTSNKNGTARCSGGGERCSGGNRTCSTRYCTRTLYRTVNDYRNEPRYQTKYAWKAWRWRDNREIPLVGHDNEPRWPTADELRPRGGLQPGEEERASHHEVLFKVTFTDGKESFSHEPETENAFRRFAMGSRYRLTMSVASGIKTMVPIK